MATEGLERFLRAQAAKTTVEQLDALADDAEAEYGAGCTEPLEPLPEAAPQRLEFVLYLDSLNVRAAQQRMIEHALVLTNGNKTKAAKLLGLNVRSLRRKLNSKRETPPRDERQLALV